MAPFVKRALKIAFGWLLVVVGIIGIILPVLHGFVFLIAGLLVLSTEYEWARRLLAYLKERFPKLGRVMVNAEDRVRSWGASFRGKGSRVQENGAAD